MEINEIKDLELVKNALENYIPNAVEAVKVLRDSKLPQSIIESTEYNISRGKELIEELNREIMGVVIEKVKNKIANGEVIEVIIKDNEDKTCDTCEKPMTSKDYKKNNGFCEECGVDIYVP